MRNVYCNGFSLLELMVVVALTAVTLLLAAPSMSDWLTRSRQINLARALADAATLARTEAIRRNMRVNLCISANQQTCTQSGGWEQGWIIYTDSINSGTLDVNEPIIHYEPGGSFPNATASGNRNIATYVSFVSNGMPVLLRGGFQAGTFTVCARGQNAIHVVLAASGRVSFDYNQPPC